MTIKYNIVITIINLISSTTQIFNKDFTEEISKIDSLLYNNYHILSDGIYILDLFKDEIEDYCKTNGIDKSSVEIDEFEIVSLTDEVDVFFESKEDTKLSLNPIIKCYIHPKLKALKVPTLQGVAYDSTTIIWTWPEDEAYAHYLVEEAISADGSDSDLIIAQLPIGVTSYTETGLEPNTPYTRRLINYTADQTSSPSPSVTIMTETVEPVESLEEYNVPKNYDFTTDDSEREIIDEKLTAFHSGIGDDNDLKVYKQMDADFYQKFKAYFEITGRRVQKEKRYDQVGFHYKICLEATETIEEQEGEVTFKLDAYPREDVTIEDYMWGTQPVKVYAKLYATIFLRKPMDYTETLEIETMVPEFEEVEEPGTEVFEGNPLGVVFILDRTKSLDSTIGTVYKKLGNKPGSPVMKKAACDCITAIEKKKASIATATGSTPTIKYAVISYGDGATVETNFTNAANAQKAIQNISINDSCTSWGDGIAKANSIVPSSSLSSSAHYIAYFFSDGFPNTPHNSSPCYDGNYSTSHTYNGKHYKHELSTGNCGIKSDLQSLTNTMHHKYDKVGSFIFNFGHGSTYTSIVDTSSSGGTLYRANYIETMHKMVAKPTSYHYFWNDAASLKSIFLNFIKQFTITTPGTTHNVFKKYAPKTLCAEDIPYDLDHMIAVPVETALLGPFSFDHNLNTKVIYSEAEKRAIIDKTTHILPFTTKISNKSVYDLLLDAAKNTPQWAAGYNQPIMTSSGGYLIKGLTIKDTYAYADEDALTSVTFNSSSRLEYGKIGSINVYTDIDDSGTTTKYGDDCYVISQSNYVYIDGYTDAIIYDGPRFVTVELNAYDNPSAILMSASMDYSNYLHNRKAYSVLYTGAWNEINHRIELIERGKDTYFTGYTGLIYIGDAIFIYPPISTDLVAHNDEHYKSPILNYRFNLEDPDAKTPMYEILPTCDPFSNYKHVVILHVYYARNVYISDETNYVSSFGDDPIATVSSPEIPLVEGLYKWTLKVDPNDNGKYIDEWIWFCAKPMLKTQDYYDELPGEGMDSFYGLVNGRYREDNQDGKQDLRVDTPKFNIPTTVNTDTIRIYIMITEYYPSTALVSYKWEHPFNNKDGITIVNGDYVTFSSDSVTYKDVEYFDVIETINMPNLEVFDNKTKQQIFEIKKPTTIYDYTNYYLSVTTDNGDVLAMRFPHEITFDDHGLSNVGVDFKGVVNATSQWAPRIHNGFYYLNQHEYFAYCEFNVDANFETYEEMNFKNTIGYISFDIKLRHIAKPTEEYDIVKNTRSELLQDEKLFQWDDGKGLTLKPSIDGLYFKDYTTSTYISPIIMFPHILTEALKLKVSYSFTDGSTYLPFYVRSYDIESGDWTAWVPFTNDTVPTCSLSCAYQVMCELQATTSHTPLTLEDYMCCYLDWKDDINEANTTNIVTITDHMMAGPYESEGEYVSKILDFGCSSSMMLDIFESNYVSKCKLYIAFSEKEDSLLMENVAWIDITSKKDTSFTGRYFRYKIVIPYGEKVYWLHKKIITKQTSAILPYITQIEMKGKYTPADVVTNFINTEAFELPSDGEVHTVVNKITDVIGADVIAKGFTLDEVEHVTITCTSPSVTITYNDDLKKDYPTAALSTGITAKVPKDYDIIIKNTPYILIDKSPTVGDDVEYITIKGTPQQYCPITVEDEFGNTYRELYNAEEDTLHITDTYVMETKEKYIEMKRNDFILEELKVYLNGVILTSDFYKIVNHLLIFNDFLSIGDKVEVTYRILYSFRADIDRAKNTTKLTLYSGKKSKKYKVYFETSTKNNKFLARELSLNPIYRTDYKGFIYLTDEHNDPYKINIYCNPKRIKAGGYDKVDISIEVLDIIDNPIISKDIAVDCKYGILNCDSYTTDMNGVVHIVYESAYMSTTDIVTVKVTKDDDTILQESIEIINE